MPSSIENKGGDGVLLNKGVKHDGRGRKIYLRNFKGSSVPAGASRYVGVYGRIIKSLFNRASVEFYYKKGGALIRRLEVGSGFISVEGVEMDATVLSKGIDFKGKTNGVAIYINIDEIGIKDDEFTGKAESFSFVERKIPVMILLMDLSLALVLMPESMGTRFRVYGDGRAFPVLDDVRRIASWFSKSSHLEYTMLGEYYFQLDDSEEAKKLKASASTFRS